MPSPDADTEVDAEDERTGSWSCTLAYPDGWIEVPLDAAHLDGGDPGALHRAVGDRLGDDPALVELVVGVLADDVARGAVLGAHRHVEDPRDGHVHAHLTVWLVEPRTRDVTADEMLALVDLSRPPEGAVEEPEVDEISLPTGRALRVRYLQAERIPHDPGDQEKGGSDGAAAAAPVGIANRSRSDGVEATDDIYAVLVDTVTYLVPVPDAGQCLWLRFWTPHLAASEQLVAEFDTIARALVVDPPG